MWNVLYIKSNKCNEILLFPSSFSIVIDSNSIYIERYFLNGKKKILFVVRGISFFFKLIFTRRTILCSIIYPTILYFSNFAKILSKIDIFFLDMTKLDIWIDIRIPS